jgi:hypothetical protein
MFEFDVLHYFEYYNTLDIDYEILPETSIPCTKEKIEKIYTKIKVCSGCSGIVKEDSNKKGYHLRFYCKYKCEKCRLVFDDEIRFSADLTRKKEFTNIIFDTKKGY